MMRRHHPNQLHYPSRGGVLLEDVTLSGTGPSEEQKDPPEEEKTEAVLENVSAKGASEVPLASEEKAELEDGWSEEAKGASAVPLAPSFEGTESVPAQPGSSEEKGPSADPSPQPESLAQPVALSETGPLAQPGALAEPSSLPFAGTEASEEEKGHSEEQSAQGNNDPIPPNPKTIHVQTKGMQSVTPDTSPPLSFTIMSPAEKHALPVLSATPTTTETSKESIHDARLEIELQKSIIRQGLVCEIGLQPAPPTLRWLQTIYFF
jgi:hypothetical protein